jgi:hypothetical protein
MSIRSICAHLFGAVALLAALLVPPQAALAHPGHTHSIQAPAAVDQPSADIPPSAQPVEQSLAAATPSTPGHAHDGPCDRGCCAQSSCTACFSIVAPMPPMVFPPSLGRAIGLTATTPHPGINGPSLRRPPRSFA